ncbi:MAG: dissimilatory-type sulfite reductase subunit alpha [Nitrospinae bacterium]|nr:dissimilatory-type sulfite reductase subunit alpha [Nitrospinota bacterium]
MADKIDTGMVDELESGPWPSFITDLKELSKRKPAVGQLLGQLNQSYKDKWNYWQGTVLNVDGYGGGIIARYSELSQQYPAIAQFHTIRVIPPAGWVYSTKTLRNLCDIWDKHGAGIMQMHGMTGDILLLGTDNETTFDCAEELFENGWDLGGSGGALRTLACCVGQARCDMACFDTMGLTTHLTNTYISQLHRPEFPYKYKFKLSGCPNDCACSMQRSDMPIIGTWRGPMQINQDEAAKFVKEHGEQYVIDNVITRCPTNCIKLEGKKIAVDDPNCVRCMHCINVMPKALRPGKDKGVTILLGGKRTLKIGDTMGSVLVPFMKMETEEDYQKLTDLVDRIWDFWGSNAHDHERVGEFINRVGLGTFLEGIGLEPDPQMVRAPTSSPYIKFEELAPSRFGGESKHNPAVRSEEVEAMERAE